MSVIETIAAASRRAQPRIVLPEGDDARVVAAARRAAEDGLAAITLLGPDAARPHDLGKVDWIDPAQSPKLDAYADAFYQLRKAKGMEPDRARQAMQTTLGYAAMMVRCGDADGTLGGAVATTSDVVRTALQVIGKGEGVETVSSYFLMLLPEPHNRPVVFADCGLVLQPTAEELASIALASSTSLTALTGLTPRVAMLSFSTKGSVPSAAHESLGRIADAIARVRAAEPDLIIDGELQFDAAIVPEVADAKAPGSPVAGAANVFVFPSLSAGNLGYKIAQRIGGAVALGPILQGLAKPANDLSRGCTVEDIVQMIAITGAQTAIN